MFAIMSVLLTFALALFLAMVLNHPTLRGKKLYRVLVILPLCHPGLSLRAGLGGPAEPRVRLREPGAVRPCPDTVVHVAAARPVQRDPRERLAWLPLHVPRMYRCTAVPSRGLGRCRSRGRRRTVACVPFDQVSAAPGLNRAVAHRIVRIQLQQLQRDLHAHARVAAIS